MTKINELETIKINDIDYVKKVDVEKLLKDIKPENFSPKYLLPDACHTMALASCKLGPDYNILRMDIDLLKKGIIILKQLNLDEVVFAFKQDFPLVMGVIDNNDENRINGVIIAPRSKRED